MYKFYINGTLLKNEPLGMEDFTESLERDDSVRGLFVKHDSKLTFWGDGYMILENEYNNNGFCPTHSLVIEQRNNNSPTYKKIFDGLIFLSDAENNHSERTIECDIEDNSYRSKIKNNKSIKAKLDISKSKNGVTITACPSFQLEFFDPTTGVNDGVNDKTAFDVQDAFRFLIDYMTDGTVGFESDWLTDLPDTERISVLRGVAVRSLVSVNAPQISFIDLFTELNKKYNIGFVIEYDSAGNPVIRIEQDLYFFQNSTLITIQNIEGLKSNHDPERLYSKIKIGSSTVADYDVTIHSLPEIQFLGFQDEEYAVQGECNIDKTLDLVSDWIIDSNIIEDVFTNANDTFDNDIFIIQYTHSTSRATQGFYLTGTLPGLYNEQLLNTNVSSRWKVQGDIALYLSNTDPAFTAFLTGSPTYNMSNSVANVTISPFPFQDDYTDGNDVNNVYGNGTAQGNPVSQTNSLATYSVAGYYVFETFFQGIAVSYTTATTDPISAAFYEIRVKRFNSGGSLIETRTTGSLVLNIPPDAITTAYTYPGNYLIGFNLVSGDYVHVEVYLSHTGTGFSYTLSSRFLTGARFRCISSSTSGGVFQTGDVNNYMVRKFNFTKGLSLTDWETIKANPSGAITFNHDGITNRTGWIRKIERNSTTSEAEFELITNVNSGG